MALLGALMPFFVLNSTFGYTSAIVSVKLARLGTIMALFGSFGYKLGIISARRGG